MNLDETAALLVVIQGFDHRTVGETELFAWQATLHDAEFTDARDAVIAHYRDSRDWIMPVDVRSGALLAAQHRAGRAKLAELEPDDGPYTPMTEADWERFAEQAKAHGVTPRLARNIPAGVTRPDQTGEQTT